MQAPPVPRPEAPLSAFTDAQVAQYSQALGELIEFGMPPGPSVNGRALFMLVIVDPDDKARIPFPYVTNADTPSLAPVLAMLAARFGSKNPDLPSGAEMAVDALRKLSAAVEEYHDPYGDHSPDGERSPRYDDARTLALRVIDALTPDASPGKLPNRAVSADPEPFRTRPGDDTP